MTDDILTALIVTYTIAVLGIIIWASERRKR
jgi:hypothetical protein